MDKRMWEEWKGKRSLEAAADEGNTRRGEDPVAEGKTQEVSHFEKGKASRLERSQAGCSNGMAARAVDTTQYAPAELVVQTQMAQLNNSKTALARG